MLRHLHEMAAQQGQVSISPAGIQPVTKRASLTRIETNGRLIKKKNSRLVQDSLGQPESLTHPPDSCETLMRA